MASERRRNWQDVAHERLERATESIASAHECIGNALHGEVAKGERETRSLAEAFDSLTALRLELVRVRDLLGAVNPPGVIGGAK